MFSFLEKYPQNISRQVEFEDFVIYITLLENENEWQKTNPVPILLLLKFVSCFDIREVHRRSRK
jgi:hypothetical protein